VLNLPGYVSDHSLAIDPANTQTLFAIVDGQLQKTTNAGTSWAAVTTTASAGSSVTSTLVANSILYLGTSQNGVLRSSDGGANWSPTSLTANNVHCVVASPSASNEIYAGVLSGSDSYVTKFNASGSSLSYSTYLGGGLAGNQLQSDESMFAIAVDNSGNAYVTGGSAAVNFPTQGAIQSTSAGASDVVLAKLNASGSALLFSTYLGGSGNEFGRGVGVSSSGSIYLTGNTGSGNFPTVNAAQPAIGGGSDAFLVKYDPSGGTYATSFSTFLGGAGNDQPKGLAVDGSGNVYIAGQTNTGGLATAGAAQTTKGSQFDGFLAKYNSSGVKSYFTYVGGSGAGSGEPSRDIATGVAVDSVGNAYVTGYTRSNGFPTSGSLKTFNTTLCDGVPCYDAFVTEINASGSARVFSTLLGGDGSDQSLGIALDPSGGIYVAGSTTSLEAKPGAVQTANAGSTDAFVTKLAPASDLSLTLSDSPDPVSINSTLTYTITVTSDGILTGIIVSDTLPANTTFISATSSQGSCSGTASINCNLGNLSGGQNATVTIQVTPTKEGTISNTASATCSQAETNTANNSATQDTRVTVGTVYTVNSTADTDDGACTATGTGNGCTLREAINAANVNGSKDTVFFNIGSGAQTITPTSSLPNLSTPVYIDGSSQPGFAGQPIIEISGASAGTCLNIPVSGGGSTIRGLVLNRCNGHGISIDGSNNVIQGNYVGTNLAGTASAPVLYSSIFVAGSNNQIGGTNASARNILSGNGHQGIAMTGSGNTIQGNYIGTNASGTAAIGGGAIFVFQGASNNMIGGTTGTTAGGPCTGACNLVSGNNGSLSINTFSGAGATNNTVQGNFIGLNVTGTASIANSGGGVRLSGVSGNHIIGNVIAGNTGTGISLSESDSTPLIGPANNDVRGNFIGTNPTGSTAFPNMGNGIELHGGAHDNIIGGTSLADRNVISGNNAPGVGIGNFNGAAINNLVYGNYIGTNASGSARLSNNGDGVSLFGVSGNHVGGTLAGQGNLIAGNNGRGITLGTGSPGGGLPPVGADSNFVQGNLIGTNAAGTAILNNGLAGISLNGANNNLIGGTTGLARNVICGSGGNGGINLSNNGTGTAGSNGNRIQGNYIGTDITGTFALANNNGIALGAGSSNNQIGGDDAADGATDGVIRARNLIAGNLNDGINIGNSNGQSNGNIIQGNYIGVNVSGNAALANNQNGVSVNGVNATQIGGTSAGAGNLIAGNNQSGINLNEASPGSGQANLPVTNTHIEGNFIGTNAAGTAALRNQQSGVNISGTNSSNNYVGGSVPGARNLIGASGGNAVSLNTRADGNFVLGNWMGVNTNGTTALVTNVSGTNSFGNGSGIVLTGSSNNQIGGVTAAERNVIAGNGCQGINIINTVSSGVLVQSSGNRVQGNYVGLNAAGTDSVIDPTGGAKFGNKCSGIFLAGTTNNLIGGTAPGAGNVIGGSAQQGVVISNNNNVSGSGNTIQGNIIGSNVAMTAPLPNGIGIFLINGASNNTIGGDDDDDGSLDGVVSAGNKIFGSLSDAINIQSAFINGANALATGNVVQGNLIGGSALLRNISSGVNLTGAMNTLVGGSTPGAGNTISFNNNNGIVVNCSVLNGVVTCGVGNNISRNSIFSHPNNLGIRLNANGASTGNNNQQSPTVSFASVSGSGTVVNGSLTATANQNYTLEFFSNDACSPSGQGEGQTYIGTYNVTTDASGTVSFTTPVLGASGLGKIVTATATHATNGTSRFSFCRSVAPATAALSGRATDQTGNGISGVTVTLSGSQSATATTGANGDYAFPSLAASGSYTVVATQAGVVFYPATYTVNTLPGDQKVNFTKAITSYTVTDLGALTAGPQSIGWDVNNSGQVTGWSNSGATNTNYRPFFYSNGALTNLAPLGTGTNALAISINDSARIVGYSELVPQGANAALAGQLHAYFSDNGGVLRDIGTLGGTSSQAWGVNDNGHVVGQAQLSNGQTRPFLWKDTNNDGLWQQSEMIDLGSLNGGTFGRGFGINNQGVVVGNSLNGPGGQQIATLWKDDNNNGLGDAGELRILGTLGAGLPSFAQGINDAGYVNGYSQLPGLTSNGIQIQHAFIWHDDNGNGQSDAGEMKDIGTLGGDTSLSVRINSTNAIAGYSTTTGNFNPSGFVYRNNFMLDLNAAIPQNSGWHITEARGINDSGQIVGYGSQNNGNNHALLLTPSLVNQTVTFDPIANKSYGSGPFTVTATASSNLAVTFSVVSGPATVNGSNVTITGAGAVTLRATQAGDATYGSASADQTFNVTPVLLRVIADSKTKVYGSANPSFTVHYSGFVNGEGANVLGGALAFSTAADNSPVGTYAITPSGLTSNNYTIQYLAATLTIDQASTNTVSGNYHLTVPGSVSLLAQVSGDAPSALTVGAGTVTFVIRQGTTTVGTVTSGAVSSGQASASFNIVAGGAYTVYASYSGNSNYLGSTGLASLTVGNANPVPSISGVTPDSAVKKPTETGQFTLLIDGNGFMSTGNADPGSSTVDWYDRTTGQHSNLAITSTTAVQIQAVVPFTLIRDGKTVEVSVINPGPGGGASNAQPFFVTDTNATVTAAETAVPDPVTGNASTTSVTPTGAVLSAEASSGGAGGSGTLTVAQYSADPIGTNSSPNTSAFSTAEGSGYFDVYVSPGSSFTSLTLDYCNTGGTTLYWWDGSVWGLVSNQTYNPTTGCITITVTTTSSPSIAQLTGTVFGVASGPAIGSITISPSATFALGSGPITLNASITDAGGTGPYTAEINWGDGQVSTLDNVSGPSLTALHSYSAANTYSIAVKVSRGTSFGTSTFSPVVVFNTGAGSMNADGWFNSPLGAFPADPSFAGKVFVESNVRYDQGSPLPAGTFKVRLPGTTLVGTSFAWLSISGSTISGSKLQLSGTGTINGADSYMFLLSGIDGKLDGKKLPDRVRIKIWDPVTGRIVYDSQMDAPNNASAVVALGGGTINIKR
jgi:CSLREA domain-containing protein